MFRPELYDEINKLVQKYSWDNGAMKSDIYRFAYKYMTGELAKDEAIRQCFYTDWHLAKRQMTWFKRNSSIIWLKLEEIYPFVIKYIQDEQRN